jgi:hypothetical protein
MNIKSNNGNILEITDNDIEIVKNLANNFKFFKAELVIQKTTEACFFAEKDFNTKKANEIVEDNTFHFDDHYLWDEEEIDIQFLYEYTTFPRNVANTGVIVELTEKSRELLDELSDNIKGEFGLNVDNDIYLLNIQNLIDEFKNNNLIFVTNEDENQMQLEF